jgi:hypothetical protein
MTDINTIVNELVEDIEMPEDIPVSYEVWAIGYDEEDDPTGAAMLLGTFEDPDQAVSFAKGTTLSDVVNLASDEDYDPTQQAFYISIEVETVVVDYEGAMNVGTVYKKTIEVFEDTPEFVELSTKDYTVIEETGNIQVPCDILKDYNKNDQITVLFVDEETPWPISYKIIYKTTAGYYICEFV